MARQAASVAGAVATGGATLAGAAGGALATTAGGQAAMSTLKSAKGAKGLMSALPKAAGQIANRETLGAAGKTMLRAGAQNALARNPLTRAAVSGAKAVIGDDGQLQNSSFAQGFRRLAGIEQPKESEAPRSETIFANARPGGPPTPPPPGGGGPHAGAENPNTPGGGTPPGGGGNPIPPGGGTPPGGGGNPNPPASSTNNQEQEKKGDGGSGGKGADGKDGKDGQSSNPVVANTFGGTKEKTTIRENTSKSEHQHTASKETQQVPGQNPTVQTAATKNDGGSAGTTSLSDLGNFRKK